VFLLRQVLLFITAVYMYNNKPIKLNAAAHQRSVHMLSLAWCAALRSGVGDSACFLLVCCMLFDMQNQGPTCQAA
jgi:hypothetical protein